jgi:cytochrome c553
MKSNLFLSIIVLSGIISNTSLAQNEETCQDPDKADRESMIKLFKDVKDTSKEVPTTVADFIKLMPEGMRKNYVMMTDSRSFQTSDYENPRVIMKSQQSGVMASFTGHGKKDGFRGTEKLEVIMWNGPQNRYDFYEVDFPEEDPYKDSKKLTKAEKRPTVTQNPASCLNCHGSAVGTGDTVDSKGEVKMIDGEFGDKVLDSSNARPNWDPYNFWQGQLPFNRDTLFADSQEAKKYLNLIRKVENKPAPGQKPNPRLAALIPKVSADDLEKQLKNVKMIQLNDYSNFDGPGVSMFDQSSRLNLCRIGMNLKKLPFYENIKFALKAAQNRCSPDAILPPEAKEYADKYFQKRGIKSFKDLVDDTSKRQQSVAKDKEIRQRQTFTNLFKKENPKFSAKEIEDMVNSEMNRRQRENREIQSNAALMANMRFLLEPLGVQVDNWSMSIDSGTYSFADVLRLSSGAFSPSYEDCKSLSAKTNDVFFRPVADTKLMAQDDLKNLLKKTCDDVPAIVDLTDFSLDLAKPLEASIKKEVSSTFMVCAACHGNGINGAPAIPFNNIDALTKEIRETSKLPNGGLGASIINRINKPEGSKGHMPMGPQSLTSEQKKYVRDFIGLAKD